MKVVTYEGVVENGCVHMPPGTSLPEKAKVYVVIPEVFEVELPPLAHMYSPQLVHPEQADDFLKEVIDLQEGADAKLRH